jgi:hypothetical protein
MMIEDAHTPSIISIIADNWEEREGLISGEEINKSERIEKWLIIAQ